MVLDFPDGPSGIGIPGSRDLFPLWSEMQHENLLALKMGEGASSQGMWVASTSWKSK